MYISTVESTISSPELGSKIKRQQKSSVEGELAKALERLEIEDSTTDELKKAHLSLKCVDFTLESPFFNFFIDDGVISFFRRRAMQKAIASAGR
jgi:C4-type Zn-finger protein